MLPDVRGKRVLLLQGPVGPFFRRFAAELTRRGAEVSKVNFNGGDALCYGGPRALAFREPIEAWPAFFRTLIHERSIDDVFLFGDCRPMHRLAIAEARALGVRVWVFEEGYLRPDWITVEEGGVNGNSRMSRDPETYRAYAAAEPPPPISIGSTFFLISVWAALYAIGMSLGRRRYPHYRHHRDFQTIAQGAIWLRGGFRKLWYAARERGALEELTAPGARPYFLVPLQVHCDAQFQHSPFETNEQVIAEIVAAFAGHAPPETLLVLKHHPGDRAYRDYGAFVAEIGARHGCADRLRYVHDLHLPTLLRGARGVVTMNSTVGTSALHHGAPVKVLGRAIYDMPGMTYQGPLADFFVDPGPVDVALLHAFERYLRATNQINGNFYRRADGLGRTGLDPAAFEAAAPRPSAGTSASAR
jgi:capsule polysaccharide modification protein KpsS